MFMHVVPEATAPFAIACNYRPSSSFAIKAEATAPFAYADICDSMYTTHIFSNNNNQQQHHWHKPSTTRLPNTKVKRSTTTYFALCKSSTTIHQSPKSCIQLIEAYQQYS